jgi:cell division protein FtsB
MPVGGTNSNTEDERTGGNASPTAKCKVTETRASHEDAKGTKFHERFIRRVDRRAAPLRCGRRERKFQHRGLGGQEVSASTQQIQVTKKDSHEDAKGTKLHKNKDDLARLVDRLTSDEPRCVDRPARAQGSNTEDSEDRRERS